MKQLFSVLIIFATMLMGCAEKRAVRPAEIQTRPSVQQPSKVSEPVKPAQKITDEMSAKVHTKEIPPKVEELSIKLQDVHFDYDKYDMRQDAKPILKSVSDYLLRNAGLRILIEGHCDERGTAEYNLGLGDRRAKATRDYLVSLGVTSSRMDIISYGKEKPLCGEHTEDCWARSRRAHFVLLKKG